MPTTTGNRRGLRLSDGDHYHQCRAVETLIRSYFGEAYQTTTITAVDMNPEYGTMIAVPKGDGERYCMIRGAEHKSNRIYWMIRQLKKPMANGEWMELMQRCYDKQCIDTKEIPRKPIPLVLDTYDAYCWLDPRNTLARLENRLSDEQRARCRRLIDTTMLGVDVRSFFTVGSVSANPLLAAYRRAHQHKGDGAMAGAGHDRQRTPPTGPFTTSAEVFASIPPLAISVVRDGSGPHVEGGGGGPPYPTPPPSRPTDAASCPPRSIPATVSLPSRPGATVLRVEPGAAPLAAAIVSAAAAYTPLSDLIGSSSSSSLHDDRPPPEHRMVSSSGYLIFPRLPRSLIAFSVDQLPSPACSYPPPRYGLIPPFCAPKFGFAPG